MTEAEQQEQERERMCRALDTLLAICTIELDIEQRALAQSYGVRAQPGEIHPDWAWLEPRKAA